MAKLANFNEVIINTLFHAKHLEQQIQLDLNKIFLEKIEAFLNEKNRERKKIYAEESIKELWEIWDQRRRFEQYLARFKQSEMAAFIFDEYHRDHLIHSLYVYLLGHYLVCISKTIRQYTWNRIPLFLFSWGMAATLHDIALPLELFSKQIANYHEFQLDNKNIKPFGFSMHLEPIVTLDKEDKNYWDILRNYLLRNYGIRGFNVESYFKGKCKKEGIIDHGIMGSLFVLKNLLIEEPLDDIILNVASAILLHNIDIEEDLKINLESNPLAYLLILSDELQEWDRPSLARDIIPSKGIHICVNKENEKQITYSILLTKEESEDKKRTLHSKLSQDQVELIINPISRY